MKTKTTISEETKWYKEPPLGLTDKRKLSQTNTGTNQYSLFTKQSNYSK